MEESEDTYVIASLLTYLYTLGYADEGPQMNSGVPVETKSLANEDEDEDAGIDEEQSSLATDDLEAEVIIINDDRWDTGDTLSRSSTARDTPSPSHHTMATISDGRDPGKPLSSLALHVQMYKGGLRFGIPCLPPLALEKMKGRIWEN